jgi:hypothetical protein
VLVPTFEKESSATGEYQLVIGANGSVLLSPSNSNTVELCRVGGDSTSPSVVDSTPGVEAQGNEVFATGEPPPTAGSCIGNGFMGGVGISALMMIPIDESRGSNFGGGPVAKTTPLSGAGWNRGVETSYVQPFDAEAHAGLHGQLQINDLHFSKDTGPIAQLIAERHVGEPAIHSEVAFHASSSTAQNESSTHEPASNTRK